ncbi:MAG: electron transfer flavoprotein subunit beta/FixA family protein [Devosia sp.]|jgi:electron transfer flavoprotein beta subunit|uniref:electron transfer flavoprotein subunit beta/FixA family protein n=1 Tax=Devosia sp. TaxID=1871048 RepID=UPI001A4A7C3E|nr:electron transfer flavoprotein subunit beta/FixA family protein [Devosia sp.]MBL8596390.1 electron transfer flavoprotein subunit beta/FixA family protein [Devosia sp.]
MKILVAVKRVIDHAIRIRVKPDGTGVETANLRMSMNPFDRHAVEAAVRLAEAGQADEIVAVSIGPKAATDVLLTALAMGANRGLLLETDAKLETLAVAKLLRHVADEEKPDLILLGKQAVDDDSNHVGQMLAGLLGWPQATFASAIELADGQATVTREVDFGRQTLRMSLPAIVTADLRLNEPRNVGLPMVMKAKSKPLATRAVAGLGIDIAPRLVVETVTPPRERAQGRVVATPAEFAQAIAAEIGKMEPR